MNAETEMNMEGGEAHLNSEEPETESMATLVGGKRRRSRRGSTKKSKKQSKSNKRGKSKKQSRRKSKKRWFLQVVP